MSVNPRVDLPYTILLKLALSSRCIYSPPWHSLGNVAFAVQDAVIEIFCKLLRETSTGVALYVAASAAF